MSTLPYNQLAGRYPEIHRELLDSGYLDQLRTNIIPWKTGLLLFRI